MSAVSSDDLEGPDLSIIKSSPHKIFKDPPPEALFYDPSNYAYIPSGEFEIQGPGLLFSTAYTGIISTDGDDLCVDSQDPSTGEQGTHGRDSMHASCFSSNWIDSTGSSLTMNENMLSLITKGKRDSDGIDTRFCANSNNVYCEYTDPNSPLTVKSVQYTDCFKTSNDGRSGCSGGPIYGNDCPYTGDGTFGPPFKGSRRVKGVYQAINAVDGPAQDWGGSNPVIVDDEKMASFQTVGHSIFTALNDDADRWAQRDRDWSDANNPDLPKPDQPTEDNLPTHNECNFATDPECFIEAEFGTSTPNQIPGIATGSGGGAQGYSVPLGADISADDGYQSDNSALEAWKEAFGYQLVSCHHKNIYNTTQKKVTEGDWSTKIGLLQGFFGKANTDGLGTKTQVQTIGAICSPWSSSAWTKNWSFTTIAFDDEDIFNDAFDLFFFPDYLHDFLSSAFEIRALPVQNGIEYAPHPASYKTCPPNFYVHGYTYQMDPETGVISGLINLKCKAHSESFDRSFEESGGTLSYDLTVNLAASNDHDGYKWRGDVPFSLSQWIGNPYVNTGHTQGSGMCDRSPEKPLLIAYAIQRDSNGITAIDPICVEEPSP